MGTPYSSWSAALPMSARDRVIGRGPPAPATHDDAVDGDPASLVVELDVSDLPRSIEFYATLGFAVAVSRPARRFAYLTRDGCVDVMLQAADGPGERLRAAPLEHPFGRGV